MTVAAANVETAIALSAAHLGPFSTVWPYEAQTDVVVSIDTGAGLVLLAVGSAYSQADAGAGSAVAGGTVTLSSSLLTAGAWPVGSVLYLSRSVAGGQPSAFGEAGSFSPAANEAAIDHVARQIQELKAAVGRSLQLRFGETAGLLPTAAERAGLFLGFDSNGKPFLGPGTPFSGVGSFAAGVINASTQQAMLAALGGSQIFGMEYFAQQAGVTLGSANDQAAWTAALTAMQAYSGKGGLYVRVPPGEYWLNQILLPNRGGFFCDPGTVLLHQIVAVPGAPVPFVSLTGPTVTGWLLSGFTLEGGWTYGRSPYAGAPETDPWLFQYPGTIADPSHPDDGSQFGQTAIYIKCNDTGVNDAAYYANSAVNSQEPRGLICNIGVFNFGGDAFFFEGAGANRYCGLYAQNVGGRGLCCNQYDINITDCDFGATGLEGVVLGPNGSSMRLTAAKTWFGGMRVISGHQMGARLDRSNAAQLVGFEAQDCTGQLLVMNATTGCVIDASLQWANGASPLLYDNAVLELNGACVNNRVSIAAQRANAANCLRLVRTSRPLSIGPADNQLFITHYGFPGDLGAFNPFWYEDPNGDLDNNIVVANGQFRQPRGYQPDSTGRMLFGPTFAGGKMGLSVGGPTATYPGLVQLISQGAVGGQLQHYVDTSAKAAQTLTSTQNYADGEVIATVGGKVYHARATLNGTTSVDGDVHLGATEAATLANFCNAVTCAAGTRGTDYAWQTTPHPSVTATNNGAHIITLTALYGGTGGNAITTTTGAAHAVMGGATLAGGAADGSAGWKTCLSWIASDSNSSLGFGAASPVSLPIASANQTAVTITTTQVAGGTYTANEQAMLGALKSDVTALKTLANQIRADLVLLGLEKGSA